MNETGIRKQWKETHGILVYQFLNLNPIFLLTFLYMKVYIEYFFYKINGQLHIYFTWVYITFSKNIQARYFFLFHNTSSMFNVFFFPNNIHYILQKVFRYQHLEWYFCTSYCFLWTPKEPWKCFLLAWWVIMSTCFIMIFGHTNSATTLTPPPTALPVIHPRVVFTRVVVEFIHVIVYRFTISYKLSFNFFPQGIYIYP